MSFYRSDLVKRFHHLDDSNIYWSWNFFYIGQKIRNFSFFVPMKFNCKKILMTETDNFLIKEDGAKMIFFKNFINDRLKNLLF